MEFEEDIKELAQVDLSAPAGTSIDDPVQSYLKEIGRIPLLTADEEEKLVIRIAAGDEAAKERMIEASLRLVVGIAREYVGQGVLFFDLIQEGTLGLMKAVDNFDYQKEFRFTTYAARWIRQAISQTIADQAESSRISDHLVESVNRQQEVTRQLTRELGREPTVEEIAGRMGISTGEVQEIQKAAQDAEALNTPEEEEENSQPEENTAQEDTPASSDDAEQKMLREQLNAAMTSLTEQEQEVLQLRYGLNDGRTRSQEEVGEELGFDEEMVSQIEASAMAKIQRANQGGGLRGYVDED